MKRIDFEQLSFSFQGLCCLLLPQSQSHLSSSKSMIDRRIITQLSTTFQKSRQGFRYRSGTLLMGCFYQSSDRSSILNFTHTELLCTIPQNCLSFPSKASYFFPQLSPFFVLAFTLVMVGGGGLARGLINPFLPSHLLPLPLPQCSPLLPAWKANMGNL